MASLSCPVCRQPLDLPAFRIGTKADCPRCGNRIIVSNQTSAQIAPPPTNSPPWDLSDFGKTPQAAAPMIIDRVRVDKDLKAAAEAATRNARYLAYGVAGMLGVVLLVAVMMLLSGAQFTPALAKSFIACLLIGLILVVQYWRTRHRAYAAAVSAEHRRAIKASLASKSSSGSSTTVWIISVLGVLIAVAKGFRFGNRMAGGDGSLNSGLVAVVFTILLMLAGVGGVCAIVWLLVRSFGFVRVASFAQILLALGCSANGITALFAEPSAQVAAAPVAGQTAPAHTPSGTIRTEGVARTEPATRRANTALRTDDSAQRIKARPDDVQSQVSAEDRRILQEIDDLSQLTGDINQMLENVRSTKGREHVVVVNVVHPKSGIGRNRTAVYGRLKAEAEVLKIIQLFPAAQRYAAKYDDVAELAAKLDFGVVIDVDVAQRSITVDLDATKAKPFVAKKSPTDDEIAGEYELREFDRFILKEKYGTDRVVEVQVEALPADAAERSFVRKTVRDGKEAFRVYSRGTTESMLVAPVDDFEALDRKLDFFQQKSSSKNDRTIKIFVSLDGVRKRMKEQPASMSPVALDVVQDDDGSRRKTDIGQLGNRFGTSRVLLVRVARMPDDPTEREYVRRQVSGATNFCRIYTVSKSDRNSEYFLLAPVDDIQRYADQFKFIEGYSKSDAERELQLNVNRDRVKRAMREKAK